MALKSLASLRLTALLIGVSALSACIGAAANDTLRVKRLEIVDEDGKAVITLMRKPGGAAIIMSASGNKANPHVMIACDDDGASVTLFGDKSAGERALSMHADAKHVSMLAVDQKGETIWRAGPDEK